MSDKDTRPHKNRLLKAVAEMKDVDDKKVIRTHDRHASIKSDFVGLTFAVFNGRKFVRFSVNETMVGKKLGDFAPKVAPTAQLNYSGIPARKMRLVAALIKGKPVEKALNILNFTSRYAAQPLAKLLASAIYNKRLNSPDLNAEDLYVKEIAVDGGPALKRIRMQSMGRVFRYKKPFSHVAITLGETRSATRTTTAVAKSTAAGEPTATTDTAVKRIAKTTKKPAKKTAAKTKTTKSTAKTKKK